MRRCIKFVLLNYRSFNFQNNGKAIRVVSARSLIIPVLQTQLRGMVADIGKIHGQHFNKRQQQLWIVISTVQDGTPCLLLELCKLTFVVMHTDQCW
jgi:hypothetical protein